MSTPRLPFPLPDLVVEHISTTDPTLLIDARTSTPTASCPDCHASSARVPSRYTRHLRDLPVIEQPVRLRVPVRRFRCLTPTCARQTFAERLPRLAPSHAQRTGRLTETIRVLGGESGGEAGARMATRLRMPLSGETVLRMLHSPPAPPHPTPRVLGIDDFALRKGWVYGTLLVEQVKTRFAQGQSLRQIAAAGGLNTKTVRSWVRTETLPLDQRGYRGAGKIDPYIPSLQTRLAEGGTNQARLWREMRDQGFTGPRSLVAKWIHAPSQRHAVTPPPAAPPLPAARPLAWLLFQGAEKRTPEEQALVEQLQQPPELAHVPELGHQGAAMIRQRQADALDPWLKTCGISPVVELRNFADVLQRDAAAVHAALSLPCSNGPGEGQINRLKLIKRSGYGRMKLVLLRQRVLYAAA